MLRAKSVVLSSSLPQPESQINPRWTLLEDPINPKCQQPYRPVLASLNAKSKKPYRLKGLPSHAVWSSVLLEVYCVLPRVRACFLKTRACQLKPLRATSTFPPRVVRGRAERKTLSWNAFIFETKRNCSNPKTLEHVKQKRGLPRSR